MEIEYECYGVRTIKTGRTRTSAPQQERELITKGSEFGDVLAEAVQSMKISVADRLEFRAIDHDTGNDWHIRRIDLTEAVEAEMEDKLTMLNDALEDDAE